MAECDDSGVDTGCDSNGSYTMSIGSPPRTDEVKAQAGPMCNMVDDLCSSVGSMCNKVGIVEFCTSRIAEKEFMNISRFNLPRQNSMPYVDFLLGDYHQHDATRKTKKRKNTFASGTSRDDPFKKKVDERKLRVAANANEIETVKKLLSSGVNPCAKDNRKRTALHFAAAGGHTEVAKLLLDMGADPNQQDSVGNTPLHLAACTTRIEMITLLLKAGTNIGVLDNSGRSPFHIAHSKLKLLQMNKGYSSDQLKTEVVNVLEMMQVYMQRSGQIGQMGLINAFSNRLHHHQTKEEVDIDVKDLLMSLSHLNLQAA